MLLKFLTELERAQGDYNLLKIRLHLFRLPVDSVHSVRKFRIIEESVLIYYNKPHLWI